MTTIVLPSSPLPQSASPKPIDYGAWQEPIAGGTITRLDRPGDRMAMDVTVPRLKPEPDGRIWVSRLMSARKVDAQFAFPQPGLGIGDPGTPVVDGGGQMGTTLLLRGMTAGYVIREGQFFNVYDAAGRAYLHKSNADATVGGDGKVSVSIDPMLRTSPANGSSANLTAPVIVGRLTGNEQGWTLERAGTRGLQFSITERK